MNYKNNLTEGPILQSLIRISLPIIFANFLHTSYQLIDTFWVGRLGSAAIAAVSLSFPITFLIISLGSGLTMAGTILVAQYKGKNETGAVDYISAQTLLATVIVSAILGCIGYLSSPFLINMLGADHNVYINAVDYLQVSFLGTTFVFIFMVFQALMRGVGDVKTPMYIVLTTVILNLIIDPLFIFGYGHFPAFGVKGAAIATIITQFISAIAGMYYMLNKKYQIRIYIKNLKPDFSLIKKMFKLGIPSSIEQSAVGLGMSLMIFLVARFGTITLAAYGIGIRTQGFIVIPTLGLSISVATLVGQNIGAGKIERAVKTVRIAVVTGFVLLTFLGIIIFLLAPQISSMFIPGEMETIMASTLFIRIMALTFGFIGIHHILNGAFIGSGNTLTSMVLSIISLWLLRFPFAYVLSHFTGLREKGIWIAFPLTNVLGAAVTTLWFMRGTWKKKRITEEIKVAVETVSEVFIEEGLGN
ncbi:MAG: MATE family efflux transporter [Elusimicrobia bacterium]|nr:MATE family efflux transporter [Elusimicrobiota bacterium]